MASERIQRRIDALLDEADQAVTAGLWTAVAEKARAVLSIDGANEDALAFMKMAEANAAVASSPATPSRHETSSSSPLPASFVAGRYAVRRFLGEGGRKRVYLAHDSRLDREVAFCAIRMDGLDLVGHERVRREAQAMGRLGGHANLVPIYDIGDDNGTPYIVEEFMGGGDVAALLEKAEEHRLPVERTLAIARDVCGGLAFIHAGGLVHRDLKPANVFLGADGTAKIGDFGLAVALDRSRLTQHGLMLGTVAYMPPEQALGGESTPRADLYSLGAMLYEMVTGRPPFVGDDPTAVISQHINTPPVAPSWVTEHCPPSLEELILQLLGKVPADRPKSAAEVLAALERVDPTQKSATHSDSNELSRVARGVFVGRGPELEKLRKAFDEAFAGRGNLAMLVGEPGIGKTRAAQELETYARMRGATVLWGRAHESSGAPAYWPWVQAGRQWASLNDLATIQGAIDQTRGELARLFPELRNLAGFVEPEPQTDPQSAQFRLFDAYVTLIRAMAGRSPLVVVLDDLHWADKPTLLLLQHLAREIANVRVLVVGTFRDTDLSRTHPLSEALANLNREAGFQRVVLKGLARADVTAYIREAANVVVQPALVERIYDETEGNPFFLSEVVNLLTQEGAFGKQSVSDIAVPDGVKEALGRRLDRISPETNGLLQVCAVAGREFSYDTLTLLGDRDEDTLLKNIEEALAARVIEEMEQPGRYRFTHALMQETLLAELSTTRRVRLHGQVGEALERRWGDRADERASRLAEHFVEASTLAPRYAEKARRYARLAAEQAETQSGWSEAVRWYEAAIAHEEDPDPVILAHLSTCYFYSPDHLGAGATRAGARAAAGFRRRGDREGLARMAAELGAAGGQEALDLIREALAGGPQDDDVLVARLLFKGARLSTTLGKTAEAELFERQLIERLDWTVLPDADFMLAECHHNAACRRDATVEIASASLEAAEAAFRLGIRLEGVDFLTRAVGFTLAVGEIRSATSGLARLDELSGTHKYETGRLIAGAYGGALALLKWDLEGVARRKTRRPDLDYLRDWRLRVWLGSEMDAAERVPEHRAALESISIGELARWSEFHWWRGDAADAAAEFDAWLPLWRAKTALAPERAESFSCLWGYLVENGAEELRREIYDGVRSWKNWCGNVSGIGLDTCRGYLALSLELVEEAEQAFRDGLEWAEREDCPVELGRNLQGLAAVAEKRGDVPAALALLDRAAAQYQPRGVKLFLDQVIAAKVRIQGITAERAQSSIVALNASVQSEHPDLRPQAAPDGTVTIMFTDIENSTALTAQLGDARWVELLRQHNGLVEKSAWAHEGRVVKNRGDGYMLVFAEPRDALASAVDIQAAFAGHETIRVRIGLHTGNPLREGGDFFGTDVNLAARVADHAGGGEVLVSDVVHALVAAQGFDFVDGGERPMKGFEDPVRVWGLVRS